MLMFKVAGVQRQCIIKSQESNVIVMFHFKKYYIVQKI